MIRRYDTARYDTARYDTARYDTALRYGVLRYVVTIRRICTYVGRLFYGKTTPFCTLIDS